MNKIELYQLRDDIPERRDISFEPFERAVKIVGNFRKNLKQFYEKKYEYEQDMGNKGREDDEAILEAVYVKFNTNRPEDFRGHSLSVSDIVSIDGRLYYCDSYDWQELN